MGSPESDLPLSGDFLFLETALVFCSALAPYHINAYQFLQPGRFFGAMELKTLLAYILIFFDLKLPDGQMERPPNLYLGSGCVPNRKAT